MSEDQPMDIDYVSYLARFELTPGEKEKFQGQLGDVLKYFEKLQEVDVEGVEPTAHAFPRFNVWDEDVPKEGLPSAKALMNAPKSRNEQVVVPKVVE
ncbi:MAG: Asp-tRNA(Asn)/Glu-tRNA(Gln) amidotransferase subunit GatC [Opitutae bacterium]